MLRKAALCAVAILVSNCGQSSSASAKGIVHDACAPLAVLVPKDATASQAQSIADAVAMWNAMGLTQLTLTDEGVADRIPVTFHDAAGVYFGLYQSETGEVLINQAITDGRQRAVVIAHELGHAMGLVHIDPAQRASVMNRGNLTIQPTPADEAILFTQWNGCH